jgi:ParB family chromosome partitioning protein
MSRTASLDLSIDLDADLEGPRVADGKPLLLDPETVRASRWVNRHQTSFEDANFEELKAEIQSAGGNVQPIKVRPASDPVGAERYEIVFGHRRHRACLELGLKVAAVVEEVDDQVLWSQMERENRSRAPLSAWEQGMMYQRALDDGLFPNMLALSKAIGRSPSDVSAAVAIVNLPGDVVAAFESPKDIRFRDAKPLKDAVAKAPEAVAQAAKALAATPEARPAQEVVKALADAAVNDFRPSKTAPGKAPPSQQATAEGAAATDDERRVKIAGKSVVFRASGKSTVLEIDARLLPKERWAEIEQVLRQALK